MAASSGDNSFRKHAGQMKNFVIAHLQNMFSKKTERDAFLAHNKSMKQFRSRASIKGTADAGGVPCIISDMGQSVSVEDWWFLLPASEVSPHQFSLN